MICSPKSSSRRERRPCAVHCSPPPHARNGSSNCFGPWSGNDGSDRVHRVATVAPRWTRNDLGRPDLVLGPPHALGCYTVKVAARPTATPMADETMHLTEV